MNGQLPGQIDIFGKVGINSFEIVCKILHRRVTIVTDEFGKLFLEDRHEARVLGVVEENVRLVQKNNNTCQCVGHLNHLIESVDDGVELGDFFAQGRLGGNHVELIDSDKEESNFVVIWGCNSALRDDGFPFFSFGNLSPKIHKIPAYFAELKE